MKKESCLCVLFPPGLSQSETDDVEVEAGVLLPLRLLCLCPHHCVESGSSVTHASGSPRFPFWPSCSCHQAPVGRFCSQVVSPPAYFCFVDSAGPGGCTEEMNETTDCGWEGVKAAGVNEVSCLITS